MHSLAGEAQAAPVVHRAFGRFRLTGLIMVCISKGLFQPGTGTEANLAGRTSVHAEVCRTEPGDTAAQESFIAQANFATMSRNYWEGQCCY